MKWVGWWVVSNCIIYRPKKSQLTLGDLRLRLGLDKDLLVSWIVNKYVESTTPAS